jgi:31-O-methyltransferase
MFHRCSICTKMDCKTRAEHPRLGTCAVLQKRKVHALIHEHFQNWPDVWKAYCESSPLPTLLLRNGMKIHSNWDDPSLFVFYEIFVLKCYTGENFYVPSPKDVVLDVGANIGLFALFLSSRAAGIRIHCFEPAAATRERLKLNVRENGLSDTVSVYPFALFSGACTRDLKNGISTGQSSLFEHPFRSPTHSVQEVHCISLEEALECCGNDQIDLLKIDVEGAEVEILKHAGPPAWKRIKRIALEFHEFSHPNCLATIRQILHEHGFSIFVSAPSDPVPAFGMVRGARP